MPDWKKCSHRMSAWKYAETAKTTMNSQLPRVMSSSGTRSHLGSVAIMTLLDGCSRHEVAAQGSPTSRHLPRGVSPESRRLGLVELVAQCHRIAHADRSRARSPRVQGERPVEIPSDPPENGDVLDAGVRVPRRHDAATAKIREADHGLPDREVAAFPTALREPFHAPDHEVRSQTSVIDPERFDRAIGGHEQRQDVEAPGALHAPKMRFGARGGADPRRDLAVLPVPPVHVHATARTERRP